MSPILLGVDTGGTFTDFVLWREGRLATHKVLSTPSDPAEAILRGIADLGLDDPAALRRLVVVHGSTVATNAVLEGKGVRTCFITNHGLGDLLTIGRQARERLYDLQPPPVPPPVPPEDCLETGGRLGAGGGVVEPLDDEALAALAAAVAERGPEAVAVCLLFSFLDDRFERAVEAAMPEGVFVSRSSEVLPEVREYERAVTTWLNAYVGPLMERYLQRLRRDLAGARLSVMQSSGGTIAAEQAGRGAVHLLLSGPAGGLAGARFAGAASGLTRLLTFDMGGTSTDVALVEGEPVLTTEGRVGRYPVAVPMVDMHTIGAGGGSIARVDAGGLLQVGPESAGADPGPACYGRGGRAATVTDAHVVLGRLPAAAFLGGRMRLDVDAARTAVGEVAAALGCGVEEAAAGIVRVADEHMARALRVMSVQRGIDPRELTLVSFGGAGGLHVCALAEALGMTRALVPVHAGVLSALGMLAAPRERRLSRSLVRPLDGLDPAEVEAAAAALAARGRAALAEEGIDPAAVSEAVSADLRYLGQAHTLTVPWSGPAGSAEAFHALHERRYGHRLEAPVELVTVRVTCRAPGTPLTLAPAARGEGPEPAAHARVAGFTGPVPVHDRAALPPGEVVEGPAVFTEPVATTWLAPGWRAEQDAAGNLVLRR